MIGRTNAHKTSGGGGTEFYLNISVTTGALVTVTDGTTTLTGTSVAGVCSFTLPNIGTWTASATLNGQTSDTKTVTVIDTYSATLTFYSATLTVTAPAGALVSVIIGSTTQTATSTGTATFTLTQTGTYTISESLNNQSNSTTLSVTSGTTTYAVTLYSAVITVTSVSRVALTIAKSPYSQGVTSTGSNSFTVIETGTYTITESQNNQTYSTTVSVVAGTTTYSVTMFYATVSITAPSGASVTFSKGAYSQSYTSTGASVSYTVIETGTYTASAALSGQSTSGTASVSSATGASYSIVLSFVSTVLNDNSWATITQVSTNNQGANYWSVGDCKAVTLDGTVGALTLSSYTTYAFIIGFNHNSAKEGSNRIHFQLAKTALSGGTDVCLRDNQYGPDSGWSSPGAGYFVMNASNTNSGGWKSSQMRTNICGTSLSSYSGTIIAVIPAALRAVLKSVTKYTDNTANGGGSTASYVTETTDYFFLLSEFEVFGSISYGNTNEKNKQAQYAYYSAGNSKIKYKHNGTSTAAYWWLRSPWASGSSSFVHVNTDGTVIYYHGAYYSLGFAPGFCV